MESALKNILKEIMWVIMMCVVRNPVLSTQKYRFVWVRPCFNSAKQWPHQRLQKCSIHGKIMACSHLTLLRKLDSPSDQRQPPFSPSVEPRPACLPLCVRWNLDGATFFKSDLLRATPQLDWILTQISIPKDTTVTQMERGQCVTGQPPGVCEEPRFDEKWQQARFTFLG